MEVGEELAGIVGLAEAFAAGGERLSGVVVAEPLGRRIYLCAFESEHGHGWLALDPAGEPVADRRLVQEAASLAALCEVAEESAAGGDLDALRARLAELRETDAPEGIEQAEEAAAALASALRPAPRVARADYLDEIGTAARRLEQALGEDARSPFAAAMQQAMPAVEELTADVERSYKGPLS